MSDPSGGIHRTIVVLRLLATADGGGRRLKDIADAAGLPRPTTHRILASLVAEGMVERDAGAKVYRLDLFMLAARAGNPMNLRELCRPALLRLTGSLGETIFLLVRSGFDAVCIDRTAGLLPIRSFTGDIGGSVMLGIGQGAMAILAHLPPGEQDEVIRYNLPRMRDFAGLDEAFLRTEMARVRARGWRSAVSTKCFWSIFDSFSPPASTASRTAAVKSSRLPSTLRDSSSNAALRLAFPSPLNPLPYRRFSEASIASGLTLPWGAKSA
jgi:DNA-binding IclR family transcriptional regulator